MLYWPEDLVDDQFISTISFQNLICLSFFLFNIIKQEYVIKTFINVTHYLFTFILPGSL